MKKGKVGGSVCVIFPGGLGCDFIDRIKAATLERYRPRKLKLIRELVNALKPPLPLWCTKTGMCVSVRSLR